MGTIECPKCGAPVDVQASECRFCKAQLTMPAAAGDAADEDDDGLETGWGWCTKCSSLFYDAEGGSPCAAGGKHEADPDSEYALSLDDEDFEGEEGWEWCQRCNVLFYGDGGVCPAGGKHDGSESGEYRVSADHDFEGTGGFAWCEKCEGMFYLETPGVCPARGPHVAGSDDEYAVFDVVEE